MDSDRNASKIERSSRIWGILLFKQILYMWIDVSFRRYKIGDIIIDFIFISSKFNKMTQSFLANPKALLNLFEPHFLECSSKAISVNSQFFGNIKTNQAKNITIFWFKGDFINHCQLRLIGKLDGLALFCFFYLNIAASFKIAYYFANIRTS